MPIHELGQKDNARLSNFLFLLLLLRAGDRWSRGVARISVDHRDTRCLSGPRARVDHGSHRNVARWLLADGGRESANHLELELISESR